MGIAVTFGILRGWGFSSDAVGLAIALTGTWNVLVELGLPAVALGLFSLQTEHYPLLTTVALIGLAVFALLVGALALGFARPDLARRAGDGAARLANRALRLVRRGPVTWSGDSIVRFRNAAVKVVARRWRQLTLATIAGQLSVFVILLVSLRPWALPASEVSLVEAFAAWSLVRLLGAFPITPGGIGIVEVGLTGALVAFGGRMRGSSLPCSCTASAEHRADAGDRTDRRRDLAAHRPSPGRARAVLILGPSVGRLLQILRDLADAPATPRDEASAMSVIPVGDGVPTRRFPIVTVSLIAANFAVWLFYELPHLNRLDLPRVVLPLHRERELSRAGALGHQLGHCDVPPRQLGSHPRQHAVPRDLRKERRGRLRSPGLSGPLLRGRPGGDATQTAMTLVAGTAADARVPTLGASGAIAAVLGAYLVLYPGSRVLYAGVASSRSGSRRGCSWAVVPLPTGRGSFGLYSTRANGGGVAFFAHVGGFLFGVLATLALTASGRVWANGRDPVPA